MKTNQHIGQWMLFIVFSLLLFACNSKKGTYEAMGTFEADEVLVSTEVSGTIQQLDVVEGSVVEAGQFLGFIDTNQLHLKKMQLETAKQVLNSRKIDIHKQIAVYKEQIATAQQEKVRMENLLKANVANRKQLDDINAQIATLEKQLEAHKSSIESSNNTLLQEEKSIEIQISQIEDQLKKSYIKAPINGTILGKYAEMGEITMPGKILFKMANLDAMTLRAYVTSDQLTLLKIGQTVRVYADFGKKDKRAYEGVIAWISSKSEFTPKTIQTQDERANLVYAIKIRVKNDGFLKIGMYASVKF